MKRAKKPTRKIKEFISKQKVGNVYMVPKNWLVREASFEKLVLVHRESGKIKEFYGGGYL
ncbi:hypothetical protein CUS80_00265 [Enterococcus faecium]|uniref:DUF6906 family protein n=1 Tax=Enterococcus faecium TaxID=1352 RepID=UPI000CF301C2|nr:hypothetical protein [Enterococcus faecium]PQG48406.1 hypothetical protein CUS80_00265 [Enterococcus faecium]